MKKVYYIGYYSDPNKASKRKTAPSAVTKMDYIIHCLKKKGYEVEIISFCEDNDRNSFLKKKNGYEIMKNDVRVIFFSNYASRFRIIRIIGRLFSWIKIRKYLCENCMNDDVKVIIYHSLGLLKVMNLFHKMNKKFILEMEEIYSDVIGNKCLRKKEIRYAKKANAYLFPTEMLNSVINDTNKPYLVVHGTYQVEEERNINVFDKEIKTEMNRIIHCVYAGTFDPRKGGVIAAISAAEYLPKNYHIHILGFGTTEEINNMKKLIYYISEKGNAKVTYDGLLTDDDYIKFLQSCDIGLSTQNPNAVFNSSSFPSKILSYLSNGLRVVSIRIPAIEKSKVGNVLFYYDNQTPIEIANAILSVDINKEYDSRKLIEQLSSQFEKDLVEILEGS